MLVSRSALRRKYEDYIHQQAPLTGYKNFILSNLQQASDMTIANLYYYFQVRDDSDTEETLLATA